MSYYISGDCHGEFRTIEIFCRYNKTSDEDVMILLGDVGLNFFLNHEDEDRKLWLSKRPLTFLCIQGNHEERPFNIDSYLEKEWHGGIVYYEQAYPDLLFAKDGEIYDLDGKKAVVIGGAYSIDKYYRLEKGYPWFPDEQPSDEIKIYVEEQLEKCNWKVDYVFSHTCPLSIMPTDLFLDSFAQDTIDNSTEEWLEKIYKKLDFGKWYFGHFHENRVSDNFIMLYEEIRELGRDDFLQRIGRPKYSRGDIVQFTFSYRPHPREKDDDELREFKGTGEIEIVDAYGTFEQAKEVSYDILGPSVDDPNVQCLYKHIGESSIVPNTAS